MRRNFNSTRSEVKEPLRKLLVSKVDALKLVGLFGEWKRNPAAAEKSFYRFRHAVTPSVRKFPGNTFALADIERAVREYQEN